MFGVPRSRGPGENPPEGGTPNSAAVMLSEANISGLFGTGS
jgi:hypothetical protein